MSFANFLSLPLELQLRIYEWATDYPFQQSFYVNWAARGRLPSPIKHPMLRVNSTLRVALLDHVWSTKRVIVPQRQDTFDAFARAVGSNTLGRVHRLETILSIVVPSHSRRVTVHDMLKRFPSLTHLHLVVQADRQDHIESRCPVSDQETYRELLLDVLKVKLQEIAAFNPQLCVSLGFPRKPTCCKPAATKSGLLQQFSDLWDEVKMIAHQSIINADHAGDDEILEDALNHLSMNAPKRGLSSAT